MEELIDLIPDLEGIFPQEEIQSESIKRTWEERQQQKKAEEISISGEQITRRKQSPRISLSLASNIASSVVPYPELKAMFNSSEKRSFNTNKKISLNQDILNISGLQEIEDKSYKPVRLTNQEIKLCYALSYILTKESEDPQLKLALEQIEDGSTDPLFVPLVIDAKVIAKIMTGESRNRSKETIYKLLLSIFEKNHIFKCKNGKNEEKIFSFPLVVYKGQSMSSKKDKNGNTVRVFDAMRVELFRPFFENIKNKNIPIATSLFNLWIDSSLFANLLSKINEYWWYAHTGYIKAKETVLNKYKGVKIANNIPEIQEEIEKEKQKALVRIVNFDTIMKLDENDYDSSRDKRYNFKKELDKCLKCFIEYGIITDKSQILQDKKQVIFIFNPHFKGEVSSLPSI